MEKERDGHHNLIRQARGLEDADVVIKDVDYYPLTTPEMLHGDIAICGDEIVGVGESYQGKIEIDGRGLTAVPGFMDCHVHVESSLLTPYEFERSVLPFGTTTAICDPHELCNVCGNSAIDFFLKCSESMVMDLYVALSSCVPSTDLETAGARITADDLRSYATHPKVNGLAELMNVPGVLNQVEDTLKKMAMFPHRIDGHAPGLTGRDLNAYLSCGVINDHECSTPEEAIDKIRRGMHILIREGSVARNLDALKPIINGQNAPFLGFCTDDKSVGETQNHGHINEMIGRLLQEGQEGQEGFDSLIVYRIASLYPARMFGFRDRGILAPGYKADIALLSDFKSCKVEKVIKGGRIVCDELFRVRRPMPDTAFCRDSIRHKPVAPADFIKRSDESKTHVIGIRELSLTTDCLIVNLPVADGMKQISLEQDVIKIAVVDRYHKDGNIAIGFVKGFRMKRGALASSVGHDSHNICVVGTTNADMAAAVNQIIKMHGGYAVAIGGECVGSFALPLGGLMSDGTIEKVCKGLDGLEKAVRLTGTPLDAPFLQLAFLPLPVIPHLRITDRGLVDVDKFALID